jgi:hypothetical protein
MASLSHDGWAWLQQGLLPIPPSTRRPLGLARPQKAKIMHVAFNTEVDRNPRLIE